MNSMLLSEVDATELEAIEGGIVAFEYLLLATIVGLALVVGLSNLSAASHTTSGTVSGSTSRTLTNSR